LKAYFDPSNTKHWNNGENLLTYSEIFDNAIWGKGDITVTANASTAPDGNYTADLLTETTTTSAYHYINQSISKVAASVPVTYSIYVKDKGRGYFGIRIESNGAPGGAVVTYNLTTATTSLSPGVYGTGFSSPTSTIMPIRDGWYRISLSVVTDNITPIYIQNYFYNGTAGSSVYTGDGVSGVYVWGAQFEYGAYPSDYILSGSGITNRSRNPVDASGNGAGITLYPAPATAPCSYYEASSRSLVYDGSDDYILISDFGYPAAWSDPWTSNVWLYVPTGATWSNGTNNAGFLMRGGYAGCHGTFRGATDNQVGAIIRGSTTAPFPQYTLIGRDAWYNLTGTWSGSTSTTPGLLTVYINGAYRTAGSHTPDGTPSATAWHIGDNVATSGAAGSFYVGKTGPMMVYNRALSADEVKQNFNAMRGRFGV
jgi:hypothetical protein